MLVVLLTLKRKCWQKIHPQSNGDYWILISELFDYYILEHSCGFERVFFGCSTRSRLPATCAFNPGSRHFCSFLWKCFTFSWLSDWTAYYEWGKRVSVEWWNFRWTRGKYPITSTVFLSSLVQSAIELKDFNVFNTNVISTL